MKKYLFVLLLSAYCCAVTHAQIITTIAGNGTAFIGDGGPATAAKLGNITGVAIDASGVVYLSDQGYSRVRKIDNAGIITTFAGGGLVPIGDGGPATAAQSSPWGLLLDGTGNVFIADGGASEVRKVNSSGIINNFAGNWTLGFGYSGDHGPATAALLEDPLAIALDAAGNMYIADETDNVIRKVDASGIITTFAGTGIFGFFGDGTAATNAQFRGPSDLAIDAAGNIYIADSHNNRVRKIDASGIISTFAGNGSIIYPGDGWPATAVGVAYPLGVAVDPLGNVYISDGDNAAIRKVNRAGIISTIAGTGVAGFSGDGGPATAAQFRLPELLRLDCGGNVYIPDFNNGDVRKITFNHAPSFTGGHGQPLTVCAATTTPIDALLAAFDIDTLQNASWSMYVLPKHGTATVSYGATTTGGTLTPTGLTYTPVTGYSGPDTFSVIVTDCGHLADTTAIYVNVSIGPPVDTIAGPAGVCIGSPVTLTDDTTGGTWGVTNTNAGVSGGVVTGLITGIDTVTYTKTSVCGTTVIMHPMTISSTVSAGAISGGSVACFGSTLTLADPAPGGLWSSSNTTASVSGGLVTGLVAGTDTISYTVTNACGTAVATATVIASPMPSAGTITGLTAVCVGATLALSDAVTGGAWNSSNTSASVSVGVVTGLAAGMDTISYFYTNLCGTDKATQTISVLPLPVAGVITGPSAVCVGAAITLTDAAGGGGWTAGNANANVTAGLVSGMAVGTCIISYSVSNSCGTAVAAQLVTISGAVPVTAPITGTVTEFCAGTAITLGEASAGGRWSTSNSRASVSGGVVTGVSGGADTIMYSIVNGCGSAMSVYTVTIDPLPDAGAILGLGNACAGFTVTLADGVAGGTWSSSDNSIATVSSTGIVKGVSPGTAFIMYTTTNSCGNTAVKYPFTVFPQSDCITGVNNVGTPEYGAVQVYPNPGRGTFTVHITAANDEPADIVITNMVGQKVQEIRSAANANVEVNLQQPAGIYFLSAAVGGNRYVVKIVVE